jgi:hypothetical protein
MSKVSLIILSFDKYEDLWSLYYDTLNHFYNNCPYPVYLLNNEKQLKGLDVSYLDSGSTNLPWSQLLINGLNKIESDWVITLFDDFIINTNVDEELINQIVEYVDTNDIDSLSLNSINSKLLNKEGKKNIRLPIKKINKDSIYRTSLVFSLIKKAVLLDLLIGHESAWEFEVYGSERSKNYNFYQWVGKPIFNYDHIIQKGRGINNYAFYKKSYRLKNRVLWKSWNTKNRLRAFLFKIINELLPFFLRKRIHIYLMNRLKSKYSRNG